MGGIIGHSGLANVHGITAFNGTIDSDYRGTVCVILFNLTNEKYVVETGNRIAQLIIERCFTLKFAEVSNLLRTKLKGERRVLVLQGLNICYFFQLLKVNLKTNSKMKSTYQNFYIFQKELYQFHDIKDLHYKLLNILSLICFINGFFIVFPIDIMDANLITT